MTIMEQIVYSVIAEVENEKLEANIEPTHALRIGDKLLQRCQQRNASVTMEQVDDALFGLLFDDLIEVHKTMNDKAYRRPLLTVESRMNNESAAWGNHHKAEWADRNFGDISKIDWSQVPDFDLFTYSSPCQDFSNAGQQRGGEEGSGTRSSLLWECRRAIVAKKPKYLLLENVAALVSKKFLPLFNKWQAELASYGYTNFAQVLNAKDYGVPQNRSRVFLVSILGDAWYEFPQPFKLEKRLKDVLEENVDEKYYLSDKAIKGFEAHRERMIERGNGFGFKPTDGGVSKAILTTAGSRPDDNYIKTTL